MNIHAIHIYGYGKFANQTFRLSPSNLHLVYGLNEAGKTTLMSFIESVLFGFPKTKRYEPKTGVIYGGMLEVGHPDLGQIRIERTAGKPERVTVYLEDGSTKPEGFLNELLSGVDRQLYKAIYSFDVFGLQEIHKFNRDKIGRFLLFSSLFGSEAISKMDAGLVKKQEELFKPNGRKPELNQELDRLKKLSEDLKKAKAREGDYHRLLNEKKGAEASIKDSGQLLKDLEHLVSQIEQAIEILPAAAEKRQLEEQLASFGGSGESRFPEGGLFELEKLESHLHPKAAQLKALEEKKRRLEQRAAAFAPAEDFLEHEAEELLKAYPFYQSYSEKIASLTDQLHQINGRVQAGLGRLKIEECDILNADTAYEYEWKLQETAQAYIELRELKRSLDERFEQARADLEEAEQAHAALSNEVMPEDVRKQKEETLSRLASAGGHAGRREELLLQLSYLKQEQKVRMKRRKTAFAVALCAAFAAACAALFFKEWFPGALLVPILLIFAAVVLKKPEPSAAAAFIQKQLDDIDRSGTKNGVSDNALREELWKDDQTRQLLIAKQAELRQREAEYERAIQKFEAWEKDIRPYQEKTERYLRELNLSIDPSFLADAYALIKELREEMLKKRDIEQELSRLQAKKASFESELRKLVSSLGRAGESVQEQVFLLKSALGSQKEKLRQKQEADVSLKHTAEQIKELTKETEYFQSQIGELFQKAGADGREMFIGLAKRDQAKKELTARLGQLKRELGRQDEKAVMLASEHSLAELKGKLAEAQEKRARIENKLAEERQKAANVHAELVRLEESGAVSELAYQTGMQKERVAELAKKWAAVKLIRQAVKNKIDEHKKVRLPKLLQTAETLLNPLTAGQYEKIYFSETDESMMVMRKDGAVFYAHELSQATCEQLYLAIRFALALSHQKEVKLPFQLDDSFVHFDEERFKQVLNILKKLSGEEQQILYFTCHEHVREAFHDEDVILLPPVMKNVEVKGITNK
ncbi:AAA family ATPase [Bacillus paralicheniformis]|uniref:YhaN AAA domain-containing protein n=3 Tax=Bacillus paralicheniformis TaxID=1648923 RepID=A0ABY3FUZ9_9BACI|nr:AAA family ATPase [Bacillus paralicheniformis]MDR9798717.1 AAA family ATPase [Bacillus paralicheniformis]MED1147089.1 AAA family ATPase [Bacillus paralicheniformis]MED1189696.1 AAA family ATPase [Bacillus paralicheniformis]MED1236509.1 AAA family ATPase [Bacillus paralicheniformis]MED1712985.1 AAA family ATPase [Bacillus paralicheniformis]